MEGFETIKLTVKAVIPPRDEGLRKLMTEYANYKRVLIPKVQKSVRSIVKDRSIQVYGQQKWMLDKKLTEYVKNLPFHPMAFHNQSVSIEEEAGRFYIHFKTKQGETVCYLGVPSKYNNIVKKACGRNNPVLGQVELIEDTSYGWINCHTVLRLPKPSPYKPKGWIGVDIGWNKLATSILATANPHLTFKHPSIHCKDCKTQIIQLKYLLKQYARKGKAWKKWDYKLKHTIKNAVGTCAKEVIVKAKKHQAGIALENLTFRSHTKRFLVPRYKLMIAIKTLCEREGVPFKLVPAQRTSITCPKCGYTNSKNRNAQRFECLSCNYKADADITASMNIGAIALGLAPNAKTSRLYAEEGGDVATPLSTNDPMTFIKAGAKPT